MMPRPARFALYRSMIDCDASPDRRLELKIAETVDELEACFKLLHDAYVASGFMRPDPSGMRVTMYHALPTTTTLCAKYAGRVVGTITIIREGSFGFPMQSAFDLAGVRAKGGNIAEISALAVHPDFRATGGNILFPLMKFMYEYCVGYFDTRHLVIAVNPNRIELYESLLFFRRLQDTIVDRYDFANGAPAVGATLDLHVAPRLFDRAYHGKRDRKNLHKYFLQTHLPNIRHPGRPYFTTNDPVMTAPMLDHFFNRKTNVFERLDERKKQALHTIYDHASFAAVLPASDGASRSGAEGIGAQRYSVKCPAHLDSTAAHRSQSYDLDVTEVASDVFRARSCVPLPPGVGGQVTIDLGERVRSVVQAIALPRRLANSVEYCFKVQSPDSAWRDCVNALQRSQTYADLATV